MAKQRVSYICSECGHIYPKWVGRCTECGEWNTVSEQVELPRATVKSGRTLKPKSLSQITGQEDIRCKTGSAELDRVLGGGLVAGSCLSPSKYKTVSTMCSSTFGPAIPPSLLT